MKVRKVDIRPVGIADLPAVTHMTHANMIGVDYAFTSMVKNPMQRLASYITLPLYFLMSGRGYKAMVGGRTVGCAFLNLRDQSGYVFNVSVNKLYRRQGIGRQLMDKLEAVTREHGRKWMALQVDHGNLPAQQLYAKLRYREYHPHFLRHHEPNALDKVLASGISIELMARYQGRRLFRHYLEKERNVGDSWARRVIGDYDQGRPGGDDIWRCKLDGEEIGCAQLVGPARTPMVHLALKPAYWGHICTEGVVKQLLDQSGHRLSYLDLYLSSSGHHNAAESVLAPLGFQKRCRMRMLMLKPLE